VAVAPRAGDIRGRPRRSRGRGRRRARKRRDSRRFDLRVGTPLRDVAATTPPCTRRTNPHPRLWLILSFSRAWIVLVLLSWRTARVRNQSVAADVGCGSFSPSPGITGTGSEFQCAIKYRALGLCKCPRVPWRLLPKTSFASAEVLHGAASPPARRSRDRSEHESIRQHLAQGPVRLGDALARRNGSVCEVLHQGRPDPRAGRAAGIQGPDPAMAG
jgi:hypothetical protein